MSVKPKDDEYDYLFKGTSVICRTEHLSVILIVWSGVGVVFKHYLYTVTHSVL